MADSTAPTPRFVSADRRHPLVNRLAAFVTAYHVLDAGTLVVAASGGADSTALLHLLLTLKARRFPSLKLHVAHLDHGLRSEAADDAAAVSALAAAWDVPVTAERRDVGAYRVTHKLSVEQAAREVRYAFFAEVARRAGACQVAAGHTADDQAETVLLHVIRGAGTLGLRGIMPKTCLPYSDATEGLVLLRPLLEISRKETEGYCRDLRLPIRDDPSNQSPVHLRNRLRHEVLPALEQINPRVRQALFRLARHAADDQTALEAQLDEVWADLTQTTPGRVAFNPSEMARLSRALQKYAVRRAVSHLLGDLQGFALVHIEDVLDAFEKPVGTELSLPRGVHLHRSYGEAVLSRRPAVSGGESSERGPCPHPPLDGPYELSVPGQRDLPGWTVQAWWEDAEAFPDPLLSQVSLRPEGEGIRGWQVRLDAAVIAGPLTLRARRPGDRFQPLGMEGTKKLQDFFVDARVPRPCRDHVPLLVAGEEIVWVVGWRLSQRARLTSASRRVLVVDCRPAGDR